MAEAAKKIDKSEVVKQFDKLFLTIFSDLSQQSISHAACSTEEIFKLSSDFLSKPATDILRRFQELYFGEDKFKERNEKVNKDVDNIIEQVEKTIKKGEDPKAFGVIEEDQIIKIERLGLSGLQKRLEGLITLDVGIREKIIPALNSMQFEDAVRQRLDHILKAWEMTTEYAAKDDIEGLKLLSREIADILSSIEETNAYYEIVLKEDPPESGASPEDMLLF